MANHLFITSLHNFGTYLYDAERYNNACTAEEAIMLRRKLYCITPHSYRVDLATSLHKSGDFLRKARRYREACAADEEAIKLRRELFQIDPDVHRANLAASLYNFKPGATTMRASQTRRPSGSDKNSSASILTRILLIWRRFSIILDLLFAKPVVSALRVVLSERHSSTSTSFTTPGQPSISNVTLNP